jgi:hypothetical protein
VGDQLFSDDLFEKLREKRKKGHRSIIREHIRAKALLSIME